MVDNDVINEVLTYFAKYNKKYNYNIAIKVQILLVVCELYAVYLTSGTYEKSYNENISVVLSINMFIITLMVSTILFTDKYIRELVINNFSLFSFFSLSSIYLLMFINPDAIAYYCYPWGKTIIEAHRVIIYIINMWHFYDIILNRLSFADSISYIEILPNIYEVYLYGGTFGITYLTKQEKDKVIKYFVRKDPRFNQYIINMLR